MRMQVRYTARWCSYLLFLYRWRQNQENLRVPYSSFNTDYNNVRQENKIQASLNSRSMSLKADQTPKLCKSCGHLKMQINEVGVLGPIPACTGASLILCGFPHLFSILLTSVPTVSTPSSLLNIYIYF